MMQQARVHSRIFNVCYRSYASRRDYRIKSNFSPDTDALLAKGLEYEDHCLKVLRQYSFLAIHKGYAGDKGIDFQGVWTLVPEEEWNHSRENQHMVNIIGQCKHEIKNSTSTYIKELEGVLSRWKHKQHHGSFVNSRSPERLHNATKSAPMIGVIVTPFGFANSAIEAFLRCNNPMIMAVIRPETYLPDPENPTSEQLKACLMYWRPNAPCMQKMPGMAFEETMEYSTDGISPSIKLSYNDKDLHCYTLPGYVVPPKAPEKF